jgi:competence protein ComEA
MIPNFSNLQKRAVYVALATALAVAAIFFSLSQSNSVAQGSTFSGPSPRATPEFSVAPEPVPTVIATIVVDVAGKVAHPGVYTLPQGSRAIDAIKRAGNALRGVALTDINLAEVLSDGQQIIVGAPPTSSTSRSKKVAGAQGNTGKITSGTININTASILMYQRLPGIGEVMAARIFAYRTAHGSFKTVNDITKVSGMGKSKFANLKSFIRV